MNKAKPTKVIFRKWKSSGDIIALFPQEASSPVPYYCSSYERVGQHSAADPQGLIDIHTVAAKPEEYAELKAELERIGYVLKIAKRTGRADLEIRRKQLEAVK